ncbi:restriction endonuclease subunit S [Paenibacillus sp. MWE-103]|uniref:Restriction endonuclease subunit S n=1 Tax=Paenibacillus artemisiicola TaxID=1172618 RepID=A0ABS3WFH5_9BACL|nr:restriction endonuclease subunit S [Paenibacillus artemisiicola]MBO7747013.1 restriction endonuclease subunit S [Paenibacillus artemisiicola]
MNWTSKKLKRIIKYPLAYGVLKPDRYLGPNSVPLIRIMDIIGHNQVADKGFEMISPQINQEFKRTILKKGDVVLSVVGTIGKVFIVNDFLEGFNLSRALARIQLRSNFDPQYIMYYFQSKLFENQSQLIAYGSAQKVLNLGDLDNFKIPLPNNIDEQRAVVSFLNHNINKLDELIIKKKNMIELLKEYRQAIIDEAVTKGLDSNAPMKESGVKWLGKVPAHWEVKRLKFIADVRSGVTKGKDLTDKEVIELPYLRVANVQDGYLDLTDVANIQVAQGEEKRYQLKYGDVLMNEGGDYDKLGRGAKWEAQIELCLHQNHVFAVRPKVLMHSDWLDLITSTSYAKFYFMMHSKQSTNLASISSSSIKELPIILPPDEELDRLIKYTRNKIHGVDSLSLKVKLQLEKLLEYRQSLISKAVIGKIDVREFSKEGVQ